MNLNDIDKIIAENFPRKFLTLSSSRPYCADVSGGKIIITTNCRKFEVDIDSLYDIFVDVISIKSFEIKEYKYRHKHSAYLLPIVKSIVIFSDMDIDSFTPPKGGWKDELSHDDILLNIEREAEYLEQYVSLNQGLAKVKAPVSQELIDFREKNVLVEVHYATNRKHVKNNNIFSNEKSNKVSYGSASISIPKNNHRSGCVERPLEIFNFIVRENKKKHFVIDSFELMKEGSFFEKVKYKSNGKKLMVYIHGYNVKFKDALFKSAQIKYDLNFEWPLILFSWPSKSDFKSYAYDKEAALYSAKDLQCLLDRISEMNIDEVVFVGHSMGAFCLAEALKSFTPVNNSFKRLVLAAADIRKDEFLNTYADKIRKIFDMISLYSSSTDKALIASGLINESERVGDARRGVFVVEGFESIDMSGVDNNVFALGHSYVTENNRVLDDLHNFLINGLPAEMRRLKELLNNQSMRYWAINI